MSPQNTAGITPRLFPSRHSKTSPSGSTTTVTSGRSPSGIVYGHPTSVQFPGSAGGANWGGVAIDPELTLPVAREWAHSREGVVALRTPLSHERARQVVRLFFMAVSREDLDALRQSFTNGAQQLRPGAARGEEALPAWSRRFSRLDYYPLTGSIYWSDDAIEIARLRDASADADHFGLSTTLADEGGALVARATVVSARAGTPLFGESLSFVLRRVGDEYLIEQVVEDFTPP